MTGRKEWADRMEALHREAAGVLEICPVLRTDMSGLMLEAGMGCVEALRLLQAIEQMLCRMQAARWRDRPICGCCSGALPRGGFSFVVAFPSGRDNPGQTLALAICPKCGTDHRSVLDAGIRGLKDIWPDARPITVNATAGHA